MKIEDAAQLTQSYFCLDCGVCTGSCPVSRVLPSFSPRLIVEKALLGLGEELLRDRDLWSCLTCSRCFERCPSSINFPEFMRLLREEALQRGTTPMLSHHGMLQTIMELQTQGIKENKTQWASEAGQIADRGDTFFFVGCMPYFQVIFADIGVDSLSVSSSIIKILNAGGITPVVSNDEHCCGHDMLWNGNVDVFKKLAAHNLEVIRASGARRVVFNCPEGYYTFKHHYQEFFGDLGFEVVHFYELVSQMLAEERLQLRENGAASITFHDPCRLGRMAKIYDAPREILSKLPGCHFVEMERNRENAVCCGTSGWANCGTGSKRIQAERLQEAAATGARTLVTACPKCQIHLNCALGNLDMDLEIKDLTILLAEAVG
ncbi:MAG: (Fe-S)-binding protein [Deltaproteobacteria bacterium]|nr:(Fe-S)-binding protein [Deltaproteobacteria bacterium]MBW2071672.1 (Fe-S)-binding protein [Deltaproteobacteria bacterium]